MKVKAATDLRVWKAESIADRFWITVPQARTLKAGSNIDVDPETGEKMIRQGFADAITDAITDDITDDIEESNPAPEPELEENDGD